MPRKKLEYSDIFPYHIYGRANNSEWFSIPINECWDIFCSSLNLVSHTYNFKVHAFVLMNNHYHMVASAPDNNLSLVMNRFATEVSRAINKKAGRANHVFGGQYRATIIKNGKHFIQAMRYVYQNPIAAGLSEKVEDYQFSSVGSLIDKFPFSVPLSTCDIFQEYIPKNHIELINLMNELYSVDQRKLINKAMKRTEYKINKREERNVF